MILFGAIVSVVSTVVLCPLVIGVLRRRAVLDEPVARSSHSTPTLRGGGIAPALGACAGAAVAAGSAGPWVSVAAAIALLFGAIGLADDLTSLSATRRLALQVGAGAAVGIALAPHLVPSGTDAILVGLAAIASALWLVSYVNAFNFMDGINGIAVAQVTVAGVAWALVGAWQDEPAVTAGGLVIAAAAVAFAPFNFPRAKVFLGDVGSYFFGGWLAVMAIVVLDRGLTPEMAVAPLLLYLTDTGSTLVSRIARRERWMEPHRDHTYQRLLDGGWTHAQTTGFVAAVLAGCCLAASATLVGTVAWRVAGDLILVLLCLGYLLAPRGWRRAQWTTRDFATGGGR